MRPEVRRLAAFGRFWYDFVIGDDWTVAAGVAVALLVTYLLAHSGTKSVWFVLPAMVAVGLSASLWRATARRPPPG
jgi:hypothetical protein